MPEKAPAPTQIQFEQIAFAIDPNASILRTRPIVGGISCRMDVMSLQRGTGERQDVVVRQYGLWQKDAAVSPSFYELSVLNFLKESSVAAPDLVLGAITEEILGRPSCVISYVDGGPLLQPKSWQSSCSQLVEAIHVVHELDTSRLKSVGLRKLSDRIDEKMQANEPSANAQKDPLGPDLYEAMQKLWPRVDKSREQLLHFDYWAGNTLWKEDQLIAIVDWEQPRLGEPTYDIANIIQDALITGIDVEEHTLTAYSNVSDEPLRDYGFWSMYSLYVKMPTPGLWAEDFEAMGGWKSAPEYFNDNLMKATEKTLIDYS